MVVQLGDIMYLVEWKLNSSNSIENLPFSYFAIVKNHNENFQDSYTLTALVAVIIILIKRMIRANET